MKPTYSLVQFIANTILESIYQMEDRCVLSLIPDDADKILDYGCGLGRYIFHLRNQSISVTGVDVNVNTINKLRASGFDVCTPEEFWSTAGLYDCILLSHVIEHLYPLDMVNLLDALIDRLKDKGCFIVASPLSYNDFYDDYDHIKPYTHKAISMLFSDYSQQSIKPRHRLRCDYVWYRKWPWRKIQRPGQGKLVTIYRSVINLFFIGLFKLSCGLIAQRTGWVGLFIKER